MDDDRREPWEGSTASFDDPDIAALTGPVPPEPEALDAGCYWRLRPGEPLDEVAKLPRHRKHRPVILFGGPTPRLVLDLPHGRRVLAVPTGAVGIHPGDVVGQMVMVVARHPATGHISNPDRYLIVLNAAGDLLARMDFSASWELRTDSLKRICDLAGVAFSFECYDSEAELLQARPEWAPAHVALEVEHPIEADVRDFGMSLWYGTFIALALLGATGMELIFGTPVRFVVFTAAFGGFVVATIITTWSNVRWKSRHRRV